MSNIFKYTSDKDGSAANDSRCDTVFCQGSSVGCILLPIDMRVGKNFRECGQGFKRFAGSSFGRRFINTVTADPDFRSVSKRKALSPICFFCSCICVFRTDPGCRNDNRARGNIVEALFPFNTWILKILNGGKKCAVLYCSRLPSRPFHLLKLFHQLGGIGVRVQQAASFQFFGQRVHAQPFALSGEQPPAMPVRQFPPRVGEVRPQAVWVQPSPHRVPERRKSLFFRIAPGKGVSFLRRDRAPLFVLQQPLQGNAGKRVGHGDAHAGNIPRPPHNQAEMLIHIPAHARFRVRAGRNLPHKMRGGCYRLCHFPAQALQFPFNGGAFQRVVFRLFDQPVHVGGQVFIEVCGFKGAFGMRAFPHDIGHGLHLFRRKQRLQTGGGHHEVMPQRGGFLHVPHVPAQRPGQIRAFPLQFPCGVRRNQHIAIQPGGLQIALHPRRGKFPRSGRGHLVREFLVRFRKFTRAQRRARIQRQPYPAGNGVEPRPGFRGGHARFQHPAQALAGERPGLLLAVVIRSRVGKQVLRGRFNLRGNPFLRKFLGALNGGGLARASREGTQGGPQ